MCLPIQEPLELFHFQQFNWKAKLHLPHCLIRYRLHHRIIPLCTGIGSTSISSIRSTTIAATVATTTTSLVY